MDEDASINTSHSAETGFALIDRFLAWWRKPPPPDPWDAEITVAIDAPEATPLCLHCLTPHETTRWFCSHCGSAVGPYNNWMPYVWIFSAWEVMLSGLNPKARFTWLTIPGYVLFGLWQFDGFAPVYWFRVFRNMHQQKLRPPKIEADESGNGDDITSWK